MDRELRRGPLLAASEFLISRGWRAVPPAILPTQFHITSIYRGMGGGWLEEGKDGTVPGLW